MDKENSVLEGGMVVSQNNYLTWSEMDSKSHTGDVVKALVSK